MPNPPETLLAKSKPHLTLQQHLLDTEQAARLIFRLEGRWGRNWCRFFRLHEDATQHQFLLNLRIAALFHDIGKANADFYAAVIAPGFKAQTLRHEHLSALVLCLPEVRTWLAQNPSLDADVITAAVLSHHLKASEGLITVRGDKEASEKLKQYRWCQPSTGVVQTSVRLYLQHQEVLAILERIAAVAGLGTIPSLPTEAWSSGSVWERAYQSGKRAGGRLRQEIYRYPERQSLLLAVKAGLIVSDSAASGLVRTGEDITNWIEAVVHAEAIAHDDIAHAILNPRIQQLEQRTKTPFNPHKFQQQIAQQGSKVLLLAACGAGKTLGAWKWAEQQTREFELGKVIFLYPTRGTATEGFRDYVGWAPEADAALVTGTARYELEAMRENPSDAIKDKDFQANERLYALGFWSRRYFSATVDQFLSFLEHSYQSLCLLPVLADSAVIIDEVHSFDQKMFQSLVNFLHYFDLPVLCMTATLPPARQTQLEEAGLKLYPQEQDRADLPDLQAKEEHLRYELEPVDAFNAAFNRAVQAYRQGERVLWVVNTVDRCLAIAQKLQHHLKTEVLTYHSRFRLCDRQAVHAKTIAAFAYQQDAENRKQAISVTTQVCEMSLDLDADVLISEVAPIPSLVQRFGRANRHLSRGEAFRAKLHTYSPPSHLPYTQTELDVAQAFLQALSHSPISQRDLAAKLEHYAPPERTSDDAVARFLDSGYYAIPGSFRDTDDYSVPCILDRDLEAVEAIFASPKTYEKEPYIINIPRKWATGRTEQHHWLPNYLQVAQWQDHYSETQGFITKPLEEVELG
jgi:CRISPR-associated endonuclease/helicase Cas3